MAWESTKAVGVVWAAGRAQKVHIVAQRAGRLADAALLVVEWFDTLMFNVCLPAL
ncbi:MAG: hypothetical protein IJM64_05825 [Ottowia sp.]|nr:hypothetical protein [Ottowia sp.]MBQ9578219.1 hypothetical protein [Ottowia sp.]